MRAGRLPFRQLQLHQLELMALIDKSAQAASSTPSASAKSPNSMQELKTKEIKNGR